MDHSTLGDLIEGCNGLATTILSFTSLSIFIALIFFSLFIYKRVEKKKLPLLLLPPGPKPWPIVGCLFEMLRNRPTFRWIHKLMDRLDTEIMCIRFGSVHVIVVTSPELGHEFLKKYDIVYASRPLCMSAELTSNGYLSAVLSPFGDQWKKMRRIVASEVLSPTRHRWLQDKRDEESDHLVRYVYNQCMSSTTCGKVNIRTATRHYCGNMLRRIIFNQRLFGKGVEDGGPGVEEEEHVSALFTILANLYAFCASDYMPWLRRFDIDGHQKIIQKAIDSVIKYHNPEIDERIRMWKDGLRSEQEDILDVLITVTDAEEQPMLTIAEIKTQIIELMLAAVDNPSNAVEWAIAEMLNQPQLLQKACDELDTVVGRERLVQEADLPRLNFIKACAREAFRLHPIAPFNVPHVALSDANVAGYFIPKGSHILLSRPGLGRNPRVWDEPLKFKPQRHIKDDHEVVLTDPKLNILSFSIGRRGCPGVLLGSTMTTMLLARLLQGFTWSLPPGVPSVELKESKYDLFLANPLHAIAKPRLPKNVYPII